MSKNLLLLISMAFFAGQGFGQVGINTDGSNPDGSAILEAKSFNKGFLPPRVPDTNAIATPAEGLMVYDMSSHCMRYYNGTNWSACMGVREFSCWNSFIVNHAAGGVAPVTKTVTYGTVSNIPGAASKCWITSNLGATHQATAVNDATEASAGWYWQFNRKRGYKHDGVTRTPLTVWITSINENSDWIAVNDPCALELGNGWRIPTYTEWFNVDAAGGWSNWNGPWSSGLGMHGAGYLDYPDGTLQARGILGFYWSSTQIDNSNSWHLYLTSGYCHMSWDFKSKAVPVRCIRD